MTTPRAQKVSLDITPYYHCVSRCVRRSFLCGEDKLTGQSYQHRRDWVESRIQTLAQIYCIDVCSYAVMSNHYHIVVHINRAQAEQLSKTDVIQRWETEHQLPQLIQHYLQNKITTQAEMKACDAIIQTWRERLYSLSWFMKELNFEIAKQANQEDRCTGHFWEGRFKSQALLDEKALLAAMAYTDLNPVRANIADTPESSQYTSIKYRIDSLSDGVHSPKGLAPFIGHADQDKSDQWTGIPFRLIDYIELVDWMGRQIREDKSGYIHSRHPEILSRLSMEQKEFLRLCTHLGRKRYLWIGSTTQLNLVKQVMNKKRINGIQI